MGRGGEGARDREREREIEIVPIKSSTSRPERLSGWTEEDHRCKGEATRQLQGANKHTNNFSIRPPLK